jgi:hypothetical protein
MARINPAARPCGILLLTTALLTSGGAPAQPRSESTHPAVSWPGFATALQSGRYVVVYVDAARRGQLPPAGARLIACDGEPAEQLARERLEGGGRANAARLLWDTGNPGVPPLPVWCTFDTPVGRTAYHMEYSAAPAAVISAAIAAAAGQSRPLLYPRLF